MRKAHGSRPCRQLDGGRRHPLPPGIASIPPTAAIFLSTSRWANTGS